MTKISLILKARIYSFTNHLLCMYYMRGTTLGARHTNKKDKFLSSQPSQESGRYKKVNKRMKRSHN